MPALQFPVIMYSIFTNVAFTYGPLFPTIAAGESLIRQLLIGFLTAFGLSTGVHLFIIPVTSRTVVFKEQAGYISRYFPSCLFSNLDISRALTDFIS